MPRLPHVLAALAVTPVLACGEPEDEASADPGKGDCLDCTDEIAGAWSDPIEAPVHAVHGALLKSGKVLLFSGKGRPETYPLESHLWDPADGSFAGPQAFGDDLFCSGHATLPGGDLLAVGGSPFMQNESVWRFSLDAGTWSAAAPTATPRYYPTVLTLPDGRVLSAGGETWLQNQLEAASIYAPTTDTWTELEGGKRPWPLYPAMFVLPSGQLFDAAIGFDDVGARPGLFDFSGPSAGTWRDVAPMQFPDRNEGMALLRVDQTVSPTGATVFAVGGGELGVAEPTSAEAIDLAADIAEPRWRRLADMSFRRTNVNAIALPDETILVVGGRASTQKEPGDVGHVLDAELYDPANDRWTRGTSTAKPRQYHSVLILLPDGRVLSAGGIDPTLPDDIDQRTMEVYSPPYLFRGDRPTIEAAPEAVGYGGAFDVAVSDAAAIASVVLIRPGSMTHHTDTGRLVKLGFEATGAGLRVTAPADGATAPPGPYMLFVVDGAGVPSVARFVEIGG